MWVGFAAEEVDAHRLALEVLPGLHLGLGGGHDAALVAAHGQDEGDPLVDLDEGLHDAAVGHVELVAHEPLVDGVPVRHHLELEGLLDLQGYVIGSRLIKSGIFYTVTLGITERSATAIKGFNSFSGL